jgi:hypothetical protein
MMGSLLKNLALSAASLAVVLLVIEFGVMYFALPLVPLKLHAALPAGVRVLAQSSKAGAVPRDYIALLGDSYAQGAGDWLLTVNANRNPPFHSAHLLQERTGRDVVSFGASGAGSLRALVTEPAVVIDYLRKTALFGVDDPAQFIVYFYEGNDLEDNLADLDQRFAPRFDPALVRDPAVFDRFVQEVVIDESPVARDARSFRFTDNFLLSRAVLRGVRALLSREWTGEWTILDWSSQRFTRARIGGVETPLPDSLQAPPLDLDEEELSLALWVHERAFDWFRRRFPDVPSLVVYVPAPLSSYQLTSDTVHVQVQWEGGSELHGRDELARRSDDVCARVEATARAGGASFLDARPVLWAASAQGAIHGPRDWKHLNRRGQEVLVDGILAVLGGAPDAPGRGCASLTRQLGSH